MGITPEQFKEIIQSVVREETKHLAKQTSVKKMQETIDLLD